MLISDISANPSTKNSLNGSNGPWFRYVKLPDITLLVYDICVYPLLSFILMGYFLGPHQTWP